MTSAMIGERSNSAMCVVGTASTAGLCTIPRCEIKIERCADGCKIYCSCDDDVACGTLQNLCRCARGRAVQRVLFDEWRHAVPVQFRLLPLPVRSDLGRRLHFVPLRR